MEKNQNTIDPEMKVESGEQAVEDGRPIEDSKEMEFVDD